MMMMILDGGDNEDDDETPPAKPGCQSSLPRFGKQTLCQPEITSQRLFLNLGWTSHLWADTNSSAGTSLDKSALMAGVCLSVCHSSVCYTSAILVRGTSVFSCSNIVLLVRCSWNLISGYKLAQERPHGRRLSLCLLQFCLSVILLIVCGMSVFSCLTIVFEVRCS